MFKIDDEVASPNKRACLRYILNREPPNEGSCSKIYEEPASSNEGARACLRYIWLTKIAK